MITNFAIRWYNIRIKTWNQFATWLIKLRIILAQICRTINHNEGNYLACAIKLIVQIAETTDQQISVELINYSYRPFVLKLLLLLLLLLLVVIVILSPITVCTDNHEISRSLY